MVVALRVAVSAWGQMSMDAALHKLTLLLGNQISFAWKGTCNHTPVKAIAYMYIQKHIHTRPNQKGSPKAFFKFRCLTESKGRGWYILEGLFHI